MAARGLIALSALLVLAGPARVYAELTPAGPEFQVNAYTTGPQFAPDVAMDPGGNFLVVWQSGFFFGPGQDGSGAGVFGRRFGSDGTPAGGDFRVNSFTLGPQVDPSVTADPAGRFTVAWTSGLFGGFLPVQDGSALGAFAQRYDGAGLPLGGEFQVNTYTTNGQNQTAVASDAAGNLVVVWTSGGYGYAGQDGSDAGIFAQRYNSTGAPLGPELQVNTYTTGYQSEPTVAVDPSGGFVVAWQSGSYYTSSQDGSGNGVFARAFDSAGVPRGAEFQANTYTTDDQSNPTVAATGGGNFVIAWQSGSYAYFSGQDGSAQAVIGRRFDGGGIALGPEFVVNTYTSRGQVYPDVAAEASGSFVVVWTSSYTNQDGDADGVFGQHFTSTGTPDGPEFQVNTYTTGYESFGRVSGGPPGHFVVTWTGAYRQDGSSQGVFAQRFRAVGPRRPLAGSRLRMDDDASPSKRTFLLRSNDPGITLGGGAGSGDDPTLSGGHLRVRSASFDHTYELPAGNWTTAGPGGTQGYTYNDPFLFAGPVVSVKIRTGRRVSIVAKGSQLLHNLGANPDPVTVILQTGDFGHRYCFTFGGITTFKPGRRFRASGAPAACP